MQSLISVIVPVYKCEKYLKMCIESIISQTYTNLEIILVDDGSPDNSPEICDWFALQDARIKVFHKSNGGASSARNVGLYSSSGDYICFVDSDDMLPEDSIMNLWYGIVNNKCQYVAGMCGILGSNKVKNHISFDKIIDYNKNPIDLFEYITKSGSYSPYSKLYDAEVIKKNNLRFDENLKCSEDALFLRQYLSYCSRIVLIPKIVYMYNVSNNASLSKKFYPDFCFYYAEKMKALEKLVGVLEISEDIKNKFIFDRAVHGLYISFQHYLMHCNNKKQLNFLFNQALSCLKIWIDIDLENVSHKSWWNKNRKLIQECDVEKLCEVLKKGNRKERFVLTVKQFTKKYFKG